MNDLNLNKSPLDGGRSVGRCGIEALGDESGEIIAINIWTDGRIKVKYVNEDHICYY